MTRWLQIIRGISMAIVTLGVLFLWMNWMWGFELLLVGFTLWTLYLGISIVELIQGRKKMRTLSFVRQIFGQLGVFALILSFFLQYTPLPYNREFLIAGLILGASYGVLTIFDRGNEGEEISQEEALIEQIGEKRNESEDN